MITTEPPSNEAPALDALRKLESRIDDLANMAGIAAGRVEEMVTYQPSLVGAAPDTYYIGKNERELTSFAVYHVLNLAVALRDAYLAALRRG